jgi:hypothetical protein
MSWVQQLERKLEPFAVTNVTLYLVIAQTFVYLTAMFGLLDVTRLVLVPALVLRGEWWRVLTFVADPPAAHWVFVAFVLYFLFFTGNSLEAYWGTVRYNLFLLVGYLLTVGAAFVTPYAAVTNLFISGSIFLAFAHLNPNFTMYVFLVLPIQIKWLALVAWLGYAFAFVRGDLGVRLSIAAALANFFIFLGRDLWVSLRSTQLQTAGKARRLVAERSGPQVRHRCLVCSKTNITHPELDFRYCSKCAGDQCYCPEHIRAHTHVLADPGAKD